MTENCKKILVRGVNWIGDAVMTMPALRSIRLAHPGSRISLLVKPWVAPLFEKDPNVDEIILYTDEYTGITGKVRLAKKLRQTEFCEAILFQNAIDAAIITFLARIPKRRGYSRDGRGILLTDAVPFDDYAKSLHHIDYYLNLIKKIGYRTENSLPWIYLSLEERLAARQRLDGLKRPIVAINPGATYGSSKRWPPERFAEVAGRIIKDIEGSAVILGGQSETEIAEEISRRIQDLGMEIQDSGSSTIIHQSSFLNLSGKTTLRDLAAVISECDALVTNDSGPMHIGYAVRTPLVAIFGSTSAEHTGPVGDGNIVIKKDIACSPCFQRECNEYNLKCMDLIGVDEVFQSVKTLLRRQKAVFFDRDGTLCKDANYLRRIEDLEIFSSVRNIKELKKKNFYIIGITNQSGIARGIVSETFVRDVNNIFLQEYGFDDFYYCPHHPDDHCNCRKPEPGLVLEAAQKYGIDLRKSYVVGDKETDMSLAKAVGSTGIMVKTGQEGHSTAADYIVEDIEEAVKLINKKS